jgi:hypothetical protein
MPLPLSDDHRMMWRRATRLSVPCPEHSAPIRSQLFRGKRRFSPVADNQLPRSPGRLGPGSRASSYGGGRLAHPCLSFGPQFTYLQNKNAIRTRMAFSHNQQLNPTSARSRGQPLSPRQFASHRMTDRRRRTKSGRTLQPAHGLTRHCSQKASPPTPPPAIRTR